MAEKQRPVAGQNAQDPAQGQTLLGELQSEVSGEAAPLLTFIVNNMKLIVSGISLLVVVTVGYGAWQWNEAGNLRDAQIALGKILVRDSGAARVTALEAFAAKAPAGMREAVLLELAASAVNAQDFDRAAAAYGQIATADAASAIGMMAALNQADLLLRVNKPAEAVGVLEKLLANTPEALRPAVREQLAGAASQAGDLKKALGLYEELLTAPENAPGAPNAETNTAFFRSRIESLKTQLAGK